MMFCPFSSKYLIDRQMFQTKADLMLDATFTLLIVQQVKCRCKKLFTPFRIQEYKSMKGFEGMLRKDTFC